MIAKNRDNPRELYVDLEAQKLWWGDWWMKPSTGVYIEHEESGYGFCLAGPTTSASLLDWIYQIEQKFWADERCMAGLLRLIGMSCAPQQEVCGGGNEKGPVEVSGAGVAGRIGMKIAWGALFDKENAKEIEKLANDVLAFPGWELTSEQIENAKATFHAIAKDRSNRGEDE